MPINNQALNRFQSFFKIGVSSNSKQAQEMIYPLKASRTASDNKDEMLKLAREKFSDETATLYKFWLDNTVDSQKAYRNRNALWDDMNMLYENCPVITKAIELIADETLQAVSNDQLIFIDAKRPVKKFIQDLFDSININAYLRPTLIDIIQYGNAGWILGFDAKGISEITTIPISSFKDRLEFSPYEVRQQIDKDQLFTHFSKITRMKSLIDTILDKEETTSYFKKYLFGFQIEDKVLPPWKFIHFRNMTNKSVFAPFGMPLYMHAVGPYKQYDAAITLNNAARVASFPKQNIAINLPNQIDPSSKIEMAMEAMSEWLNIGFGQSKKSLPGLGDVIFTIKDLFEISDVKVDNNLGDLGDLEKLRDDIFQATFLPRYMLDPRDSGFGDTGVALIEKSKPFANLIYRMQTILLENLTQLVKIHMLYTNQFSIEDTKFTLSMKFPESQTNSDIVSSQNSLLDLANNVIAAIQDKVTGGEQLPPELVKSIYTQFLPWDAVKVESWIDNALSAKENDETFPTIDSVSDQNELELLQNTDPLASLDNANTDEDIKQLENKIRKKYIIENYKARKNWKLLEKKTGLQKLKEQIEEIIFEKKHEIIRETTIKGRHVYSSRNKDISFQAENLSTFAKNQVSKMIEVQDEETQKLSLKEELDYTFSFEKDENLEKEE